MQVPESQLHAAASQPECGVAHELQTCRHVDHLQSITAGSPEQQQMAGTAHKRQPGNVSQIDRSKGHHHSQEAALSRPAHQAIKE